MISDECCITPYAVSTILEHHMLREEGKKFAMGLLFGKKTEDKVEVTDTYPIFVSDKAIEVDTIQRPVIGFYTTNDFKSATVSEEEAKRIAKVIEKVESPMRDELTFMKINALNGDVKAYLFSRRDLRTAAAKVFFPYARVSVFENANVYERVLFGKMLGIPTGKESVPLAELNAASCSDFAALSKMLDDVIAYVNSVAAGEAEGDEKVGRELMMVAQSGMATSDELRQKAYTETVQDVLVAAHLSSLIRKQIGQVESLRHTLNHAAAARNKN